MRPLRILLISSGEFSGGKYSLASALRELGCEVVEAKSTLRSLRLRPLYILRMILHASLIYKTRFRQYLNRTYSAYLAGSKANQALVEKFPHTDVVLLIGANSLNFWKKRMPELCYAILTDHTNILSKKLPDFGFEIPEKRIYPTWNQLERTAFMQQDHIFVLGTHVKKSLVEDYDIDPRKVTVVGSGPNLDVDIERDGFKKNFTERNILFVGLDHERKGLHVLRKAFARVVAVYSDAVLHVVGVEGVSSDRVTYYGKLNNSQLLKKLYYESQIFALPSFREPLGFSLLEAMWAKNVCIGTNLEAMPEIIGHGKTGFLIEPGDDDALAQRILELFADPDLLRDMAERGYQLAKSKWSWKNSAQKITKTVSQLCKMNS